jgi:hypothetical protein
MWISRDLLRHTILNLLQPILSYIFNGIFLIILVTTRRPQLLCISLLYPEFPHVLLSSSRRLLHRVSRIPISGSNGDLIQSHGTHFYACLLYFLQSHWSSTSNHVGSRCTAPWIHPLTIIDTFISRRHLESSCDSIRTYIVFDSLEIWILNHSYACYSFSNFRFKSCSIILQDINSSSAPDSVFLPKSITTNTTSTSKSNTHDVFRTRREL